jgi:hypothetical protein
MIKTLILFLLLISTQALAIDRTYLGAWTPEPGKCDFSGAGPFKITPQGIEGHEFDCTMKRATPDSGGWLVHLSCTAEGNTYSLTLRWKITPGGQLRETTKDKVVEYARCTATTDATSGSGSGQPAVERLVPSSNYANAVSGPILFSDTRLVFLKHKKSLTLVRIAHNAPLQNGDQSYPADIYKVSNPSIITFDRGRGFICDLPDPLKPITYIARWHEDAATWIGLFLGSQTPTDTNKDSCNEFTYDSVR